LLTTRQILELISVSTAFASGMLLYYGSLGIPWEMQTYKGQTERELEIKRRQKLMTRVGIPCAITAFVVQVIVILRF
jgi:hypothetical protein